MKFVIMDIDDFIFGNEEWHEREVSRAYQTLKRNFN